MTIVSTASFCTTLAASGAAQILAGHIPGCGLRGAGRIELSRTSIRELAFSVVLRGHPIVRRVVAACCLGEENSRHRLAGNH